jgi:hypothetical protein
MRGGHAAIENALLQRFIEHCEGKAPPDENDSWAAAFVQGHPIGTFCLTVLCANCGAPYACTEPDAQGDIQLAIKKGSGCPRCLHPWELEWPDADTRSQEGGEHEHP